MPVKPSTSEDEYFARQEFELTRKIAGERQAQLMTEERERERALHLMKCPKCGMQLEEIAFGDVHIDKCFGSLAVVVALLAGSVVASLNRPLIPPPVEQQPAPLVEQAAVLTP